jgi:disulfide bond formation protein DsbB
MENKDIVNGLLQLGFDTGWVVNGTEITLWENSEPMPTMSAIAMAAKEWDITQKTKVEAKAQAKALAEGKLAALGLTLDDLRALGL